MNGIRINLLILLLILPVQELCAKEKLTVVSSTSWPPLSYQAENGEPRGLLVDLWDTFAKKQGVEIEFIQTDWNTTLEMVRTGQADVQAGLFFSEQRDEYMDFSEPLAISFTSRLFVSHMLSAESLTALKGIPIGVTKGGFAQSYIKEKYPYITLTTYPNSKEVIEGAVNGDIAAFVVDYPAGVYYLNKWQKQHLFHPVEILYSKKLHAAVPEGKTELLKFVDEGLKKIPEGAYKQITSRWIKTENTITEWLLPLATSLLSALVILITISYIFVLKKKLKKVSDELNTLVETDRLTGIYNRLKFETLLSEELNRYQRYRIAFSVILLDIDQFKTINNHYGYSGGNKVLNEFAQFLNQTLRSTDHFARWGGEEFIILCPETSKHEACHLAEKLRTMIEAMTFSNNGKCTASFGVTDITPDDQEQDIYLRADNALYVSKQEGKNKVTML